MDLVDMRHDGDHATQDMKMILIDNDGHHRQPTTRPDPRALKRRNMIPRPNPGRASINKLPYSTTPRGGFPTRPSAESATTYQPRATP